MKSSTFSISTTQALRISVGGIALISGCCSGVAIIRLAKRIHWKRRKVSPVTTKECLLVGLFCSDLMCSVSYFLSFTLPWSGSIQPDLPGFNFCSFQALMIIWWNVSSMLWVFALAIHMCLHEIKRAQRLARESLSAGQTARTLRASIPDLSNRSYYGSTANLQQSLPSELLASRPEDKQIRSQRYTWAKSDAWDWKRVAVAVLGCVSLPLVDACLGAFLDLTGPPDPQSSPVWCFVLPEYPIYAFASSYLVLLFVVLCNSFLYSFMIWLKSHEGDSDGHRYQLELLGYISVLVICYTAGLSNRIIEWQSVHNGAPKQSAILSIIQYLLQPLAGTLNAYIYLFGASEGTFGHQPFRQPKPPTYDTNDAEGASEVQQGYESPDDRAKLLEDPIYQN